MNPKHIDKVQDHPYVSAPAKKNPLPTGVKKSKSPTTPSKGHAAKVFPRQVNYITGAKACEVSSKGPSKLLIEGSGGSLQVDLRGVGVELHKEAFAFRMPDNSMLGMSIHQGDIAIIEPCLWKWREGDLALISLNGTQTLRRVTFCRAFMYFRADDNTCAPLLPAWECPFSGIVTGILRMYECGQMLSFPAEPNTERAARANGSRPSYRHSGLHKFSANSRLTEDPPEPSKSGRYVR